MHTTLRARLVSTRLLLAALAALVLAGLLPRQAQAQDDPPGRVGRIADVQGPAQWFDHELGRWQDAVRNLPLTTGDRIATGRQAHAELRVGSTTLRLDARSELDVLRLDDERLVFQLRKGSLALRVRSREVADELQVLTGEARLRPLRAGHYRVDRADDTTQVGAWRGEMRVDDEYGVTVAAGQRVELWRDGPGSPLRLAWTAPVPDAFAARAQQDDERDERVAASRWVSPEMTGAEELERAGRWDTHPELGAVWLPHQVRADWAPYRFGTWVWVRPWGWTWVDEAPWGFAPFHYGRWVQWRERWVWAPGAYVARPVYAPALVAFSGGPGWSASVRIGSAPPAWRPLAPRDAFVPWYRHTPVHRHRVNEPLVATPAPPRSSIGTPEGWRHERMEPPGGRERGAVIVRPVPEGREGLAPPPGAGWRVQTPTPQQPQPVQVLPAPAERPVPIERPSRSWSTQEPERAPGGDAGDGRQWRTRPGPPPAPAVPQQPMAPPAPAQPPPVVVLPAPGGTQPPVFRPTPVVPVTPQPPRPPADDGRKRIPEVRGKTLEGVRVQQE